MLNLARSTGPEHLVLGQDLSRYVLSQVNIFEIRAGSFVGVKRSNGNITLGLVKLSDPKTPPGLVRVHLSVEGAWKDVRPEMLFSINQLDFVPADNQDLYATVVR